MAKTVKKKVATKPIKAAKSAGKKKPGVANIIKKAIIEPLTKTNQVLYVDSSFFFPGDSNHGYIDDFQGGRYTRTPGQILQAPILLPVGAKIYTITVYYKNTSPEQMMFIFLKKHIDHHAYSGEVEVSFEPLPPGTAPPDNFLSRVVDHFENAGVIRDKYLYFLQIQATGKPDDTNVRTVRGMRIEYRL